MQGPGNNIAALLTTLLQAFGKTTRRFVLDVMLSLVIYGLAVPATYLAGAMIYSPTALAQSFGAGYQKYQKGDFQGAQAAFNAALKKQPGKSEAARIIKYLGVSQFMLGNKNGATISFKRALKINPALTLTNSEVLDDSVLPYFNAAKGKKSAGPAAVAPTAAKPVPKSAAAGQAKLASGKPLKQTFLKVASNVPSAQVFVDGIIAGPVNELINTDPGAVLVEVQAKGFLTRKVNVNIAQNAENKVTVNLEKPKPKPKPKPIVKKQKPKPQQKYGQKKKQKGKKGFGGTIYTPTPGDDMFDDGGGQGGGGGGQGGGDLAGEFAMDSGGGGYGQPPGYGAPPPGYGAPPPGYGAPPPGYGYAPPPPAYGYGYAPPPPAYGGGGGYGYAPPPPPPDPGYGDPYAVQPAAAIPADPAGGDPGAPAAAGGGGGEEEESGGGGGSSDGLFIKLLPFGAGQFYNGSYMLGLLFAGAEAGAIFVYMSKTKSANDAAAATNAYIAASKDDPKIQEDDAEKAKYDKFIADSKVFVDGERKTATYGMIGFGALWGVGAIESILNGKPKKAKKKKKRKYSPFGLIGQPDDDLAYSVLADPPENRSLYAFDWQLSVVPAYDGYDLTTSVPTVTSPGTMVEPALKVGVKWSF